MQTDKDEVQSRASDEQNRRDDDHTGTQLERELSDITTYLVHQLERENWSTRAIQVYYLYIIAWESTTVSNSGLCT